MIIEGQKNLNNNSKINSTMQEVNSVEICLLCTQIIKYISSDIINIYKFLSDFDFFENNNSFEKIGNDFIKKFLLKEINTFILITEQFLKINLNYDKYKENNKNLSKYSMCLGLISNIYPIINKIFNNLKNKTEYKDCIKNMLKIYSFINPFIKQFALAEVSILQYNKPTKNYPTQHLKFNFGKDCLNKQNELLKNNRFIFCVDNFKQNNLILALNNVHLQYIKYNINNKNEKQIKININPIIENIENILLKNNLIFFSEKWRIKYYESYNIVNLIKIPLSIYLYCNNVIKIFKNNTDDNNFTHIFKCILSLIKNAGLIASLLQEYLINKNNAQYKVEYNILNGNYDKAGAINKKLFGRKSKILKTHTLTSILNNKIIFLQEKLRTNNTITREFLDKFIEDDYTRKEDVEFLAESITNNLYNNRIKIKDSDGKEIKTKKDAKVLMIKEVNNLLDERHINEVNNLLDERHNDRKNCIIRGAVGLGAGLVAGAPASIILATGAITEIGIRAAKMIDNKFRLRERMIPKRQHVQMLQQREVQEQQLQ